MIRKFITKAQDWADGKLRRLAGRISPDMRVAIILVMLAAFGALSVYMTVASIYRIGRNDGKELGIEHLFVSNAAGGMNPDFAIGDIMIIRDHINLFPEHPLHGRNYKELGVRFPDMSEAYSRRLIAKALEIAEKNHIKVQQGVYVGTQGPTFETPAEYRYFHIIGGDAVGMSTVPEVIVARHAGIEVFAVSVITDLGVEGIVEKCSHEEVQKAAAEAQPRMSFIMKELVEQF